MFEAEAAGLEALARTGAVRVPRVIGTGTTGSTAWIALERLTLRARDARCDAQLGAALARLHGASAERFGWDRDNTIGATPQRNGWRDGWAEFWRDLRLKPQLELAARNGYRGCIEAAGEKLLACVPALLERHRVDPSLVHGDLWSGNAAADASGEPVVYDPAVYYGDREADLAMTELFGGFAPSFYAAYRAAWPLEPGYETRRDLYNLYHVLNHLNLFGRSYLVQAKVMVSRLLSEVR